MEIHRENVRQGKTPTTNSRKRAKDPYSSSGNSSSFWERHSDLANPAMNPQRRGDIIKRLSTASNNFTTGARRFH